MPLLNLVLYFSFGVAVYRFWKSRAEKPKRIKIVDSDIPKWVNSGPQHPEDELNILLADAVGYRLSRVRGIKRSDFPVLAEDIVFIAMAYGDGRVRTEIGKF